MVTAAEPPANFRQRTQGEDLGEEHRHLARLDDRGGAPRGEDVGARDAVVAGDQLLDVFDLHPLGLVRAALDQLALAHHPQHAGTFGHRRRVDTGEDLAAKLIGELDHEDERTDDDNAASLDRKLVKPPLFVQTIFGILGGIGADPENLTFMKNTADKLFGADYYWSILAAGRHQLPFVTMGAIMGGNVRVGLEDSLYIGKGQLAKSNADQVRRIRGILENLSLEIASPQDAREMLHLKGGDRVTF